MQLYLVQHGTSVDDDVVLAADAVNPDRPESEILKLHVGFRASTERYSKF